MAEPTPIGIAIRSDSTVITMVLIIAGISETFSVLYSQAKRLGFRYGMPRIRI